MSNKAPLWVLPDYIEKQNDPSAELLGSVIRDLCKASAISSRGKQDIRSEKVKEIGKALLENEGLGEALKGYLTPDVFQKAFLLYINKTKPELKTLAERLGDASQRYCEDVKRRMSQASSWLWVEDEVEIVLEEVYNKALCAELLCRISGSAPTSDFDAVFELLRGNVLEKNKIPLQHWVRKYPALSRLFEILRSDGANDLDAAELRNILTENEELVRKLFFDVRQEEQLGAWRESMEGLLHMQTAEAEVLYGMLQENCALLDEDRFREQGRSVAEQHAASQASSQMLKTWQKGTGTDSPREWSERHKLPAEFAMDMGEAADVVQALDNPGAVSAQRLGELKARLDDDKVFRSLELARMAFLDMKLPAKYHRLSLDVTDLCEHLCDTLGEPAGWMRHSGLQREIESFIQSNYAIKLKGQATKKVAALSGDQAKKLLVELISSNPDVGMAVLYK